MFRKYQKTEAAEVISLEDHAAIADILNKLGKTSARNLTPEERRRLSELDKRND